MAAASCSDAQFIDLWHQHHSVVAVAKELGVSQRTTHTRRRAIEARHGIKLAASDSRSPDNSMLVTADRVEVKLNILDGVVLACGDLHFRPGCVPVVHRAVCHLAHKLKPYAVIWNGDVSDFPQISRHPSIGWENYPTVAKELEAIGDRSKELMDAAPGAKRIWTAGNHDLRFETRLAATAGEYRDVKGIHLKDHFPEWTPAWFCTINGGTDSHTEIRHREKGGAHAGYNNTKDSGVNIVTGHDHRADVVPYNDRRGRRYGVRHGMGADSSRDPQFVNYLEGKTTNWQSALAVLTYRDGKLMLPELALREDEDHFQFRSEIIKV
jgi:transposase-like protein